MATLEQLQQERIDFTACVKENYNFWEERKKFLKNVETLKRNSEELFVLIYKLERLHAEIELTKEDTRSLTEKINHLAKKFELSSIPIGGIKPKTEQPSK